MSAQGASSTQATMPVSQVEALRIIALPRELQTTYDISNFLADKVDVTATSVNIVTMKAENGVVYRSAFVDITGSPLLQEKTELIIRGEDVPGGIHYDNGKPMTYMKVVSAKKHAPSTETLELKEEEWSSIYIPFLPADLSADNGDVRYTGQDGLAELFEDHLKIGQVERIDFMSKPVPGSDRKNMCAYVHFTTWFNNQTTKLVRGVIQDKGEFMCNGFYDGFEFRRFDNRRFITFKVNHKPIPAVSLTEQEELNVHQLVAAKANLEARVAELEAELASLKTVTVPGTDVLPDVQLDIGPIMAKYTRLDEKHRKLIADNLKLKAERDNLEDERNSLREDLVMFQANRI